MHRLVQTAAKTMTDLGGVWDSDMMKMGKSMG